MTMMKQTKLFQGQDVTTKPTMKKATTSNVVSPGEKSLEKTANSSAKELTKQPAPDPIHQAKHLPIAYKIDWTKDITLRALESLGSTIKEKHKNGTVLLSQWEKEFPDSFDDEAERFDLYCPLDLFGDDRKYTWEEGAVAIYEHCGRNMENFMFYLEVMWNFDEFKGQPKTERRYDKKFGWIVRRFSFAIAHADPTSLFHIEEEDKQDANGRWLLQNSYWMTDTWSNPTLMLQTSPLSAMWAGSAFFLGHPWVFRRQKINVFDKLLYLSQQKARLQRSKMARRAETKREIQEKKKRARKRDDMSEDEDNTDDARSKAPVSPKSPDKRGARFRTEMDGVEDDLQDIQMNEADVYEDFYDSAEYNHELPKEQTAITARNPKDNSVTDNSTHDASEDHDKINKVNPLLTHDSASPNDFFAPRASHKRTGTPGQPKVLELSPKEIPKPSSKKGVDATNCTNDDIEESNNDDDSESIPSEKQDSDDEPSSSDDEVQILSPPNVDRRQNNEDDDEDSDSDDSVDCDDNDDEDDDSKEDERVSRNKLTKRELMRMKTREMNKQLINESQKKSNGKHKKSLSFKSDNPIQSTAQNSDPYDGIETTKGVYRRNSLSLEDAMAVDEIEQNEVDGNRGQAQQSSGADGSMIEASNDRSYRAVAASPAVIPTDQLVRKLLQMNMDGLPFRDCKFFYPFVAFMWNGQAAGTSITKKALSALHTFLTSLFKTGFKFKLLPLSDSKYKNQKLWIDNPERLKQLMGTWYQAKNYIDMAYGNADWISSMARSPGNKFLRTRMRFAFDDTYEGAKATIGGILEEEGGYVRDSPLQFDSIEICGYLPFLPGMMSPELMANAIMRELNYEEPVALVWEYVSCPTTKTIGQGNTKAPSTQMWGVVAKTKSLRKVDAGTKGLYSPTTPKSMMPYGAISTYFHNWKAASKNLLSVGPYGPVKEMATSLVMKAIDFKSVTETFCSPIPIPGLLKVVETTRFGEISLLRFLYSVKATPAQAESAEDVVDGSSSDSESGSENNVQEEMNESDGFVSVELKKTKARNTKKKAKKTVVDTGLYKDRPEVILAEKRAAEVLKKDAEKMDQMNLNQSIVPERTPGYYAVTVRRKVLQLALNVWSGLGAFIIAHLDEPSPPKLQKIIVTWLGQAEWDRIQRTGEFWDAELLRAARPSLQVASLNDERGIDWLDFGRDPLDQVRGYLEVDVDAPDVRDFDDGATISGAVDELRAAENKIEDLSLEVIFRTDENARLREEVERLRAERDAAQNSLMAMETEAGPSNSREGSSSRSKLLLANPDSQKPKKSALKKSSKAPDHAVKARSRRGGGSSAKGP